MTIQRYWLLDVHTRARKALPWLLLVSGLAGCVLKHDKPEGSDTMTNWLKDCRKQSDCRGAASCIASLCTLACVAQDEAVCGALSEDALCAPAWGPSYCDQPCQQSSDCQSLGASYDCQAGRCRTAQALTPPEGAARAPEGVGALVDVTPSLVLGEATLLSDLERQASSSPVVTWLGDHWSVIWTSDSIDPSSFEPVLEPMLLASDVYPSGEVERRSVPSLHLAFPVLRIAGSRLVQKSWGFDTCELRVLETATLGVVSTFAFACSREFDAAPVPNSEDWLITWSLGVYPKQDVLFGRYRPSEGRLISGPWPIASAEQHEIGPFVGVAGDDAWVYWSRLEQNSCWSWCSSSTSLTRLIGAAALKNPLTNPTLDASVSIASSGSTYAYGFSALADGALLLVADGTTLNSALLPQGPVSVDPALRRTIEVRPVTPTTISDRPPGITRVDTDLFAVCYSHSLEPGSSSGNGVAVALIDAQGTLASGPISVADGLENVGGCDLAWSGEELLVAWWDIASDRPRSTPEHSTINARLVSLH